MSAIKTIEKASRGKCLLIKFYYKMTVSNPNLPFGFEFIKLIDGPTDGGVTTYYISASEATAFYAKDPVQYSSNKDATGKYPSCKLATAGSTYASRGVVKSFKVKDIADSANKRTASTERYVEVYDHPKALFKIRADGALTAAHIGKNANFLIGTPDTVKGCSGAVLQTASIDTTNTLQLHIVEIDRNVKNSLGDYCVAHVVFNLHQANSPITGV